MIRQDDQCWPCCTAAGGEGEGGCRACASSEGGGVSAQPLEDYRGLTGPERQASSFLLTGWNFQSPGIGEVRAKGVEDGEWEVELQMSEVWPYVSPEGWGEASSCRAGLPS